MSARNRLPDRRPAITQTLEHGGQQFTVSVGYCPVTGSPLEIFGSSPKIGSGTAALVSDACVLISLALQTGLTATEIGHSLAKQPVIGSEDELEEPASLIGSVVAALLEEVV